MCLGCGFTQLRELGPKVSDALFQIGDRVMYPLGGGELVTGTYASNLRSERAQVKRNGLLGNDVVKEDCLYPSISGWLRREGTTIQPNQPLYYIDGGGRVRLGHFESLAVDSDDPEPTGSALLQTSDNEKIRVPFCRVYVPPTSLRSAER